MGFDWQARLAAAPVKAPSTRRDFLRLADIPTGGLIAFEEDPRPPTTGKFVDRSAFEANVTVKATPTATVGTPMLFMPSFEVARLLPPGLKAGWVLQLQRVGDRLAFAVVFAPSG